MFPFSMGPSMGLQQPQAPLGLRQPAARKTPPRPPSGATENSLTRILSPPRQATPSRAKMQKATLAATHDEAYVEAQDEAGMRWTKRSGFNHDQIRDFQMLLQLIRPIMIKPDKISGSREIAQGSFGTIYSAVFNKRAVAVKRINKVLLTLLDLAWSSWLPMLTLWIAGSLQIACRKDARGLPRAQHHERFVPSKCRAAYWRVGPIQAGKSPELLFWVYDPTSRECQTCKAERLHIVQSDLFGFDPNKCTHRRIVLELCTDSLQKALQKKRWPFADRMQMAVELLHGISYIHSMGQYVQESACGNA